MLSLWSLCSRSLMYSSSVEESVLLEEDHMKDIKSTVVRLQIFVLDSKIVAETDVVAEFVEDMFPSFKCMVLCHGSWRDGNHETHTQWQGIGWNQGWNYWSNASWRQYQANEQPHDCANVEWRRETL